jgi:hypothetical protein
MVQGVECLPSKLGFNPSAAKKIKNKEKVCVWGSTHSSMVRTDGLCSDTISEQAYSGELGLSKFSFGETGEGHR